MATSVPQAPAQTVAPPAGSDLLTRVGAARPWHVVLAAGGLLGLLWLTLLAHFHGHVVDFSIFGQDFAGLIGPPANSHPIAGAGYDGQFFWRMAHDPLLLDSQTVHALAGGEAYRAQRVIFPALAWILSGGQEAALPYTLQLVAWGSVLALVGLLATAATRHGRSAWWGLALGLMPGMYLGAARNVADPLAVTLMIAAVVALDRRRYAWAAIAAVAAVLTRETMIILPVAIIACGIGAHLALPERLGPTRLATKTWIVAAAALIAYIAWQAYTSARVGAIPATSTPDGQFGGLFAYVPAQLKITSRDVGNSGHFLLLAIANPLYLAAIAAGAGVAVFAASRKLDILTVSALGFALLAITQTYGDHWSYTRATAPLFALIAYIALTRGYQRTLIMIACGIVLLPFYPA